PVPLRLLEDRNLGGERIGAAHAVDLAIVRRAHDPQQEGVAGGSVLRQVVRKEEGSLGGAAAHPHAGGAEITHPKLPFVSSEVEPRSTGSREPPTSPDAN